VVFLCATLVLSTISIQAQTNLDVRKLFAEHLRTAAPSAAFDARAQIAAVSTQNTDPVPIPGGLAPGVHVFAPGPVSLGFQGLDVELNGITNFRGFSALGYLAGAATDSNGNNYNASTDMRVYQGEFVSADGSHHRGTFVFIWIDLYDPSSGAQVHDFNGHISQSGLFWIVAVPTYALSLNEDGTAHLHLTEAATIDNTFFFGPGTDYSSATFDITWTPSGDVQHFRPGSSNPTDPTNFAAEIRFATATGSFTVIRNGVTFTINNATSAGVFAEMGRERNGSFLGDDWSVFLAAGAIRLPPPLVLYLGLKTMPRRNPGGLS
jgi:hypothetical protein